MGQEPPEAPRAPSAYEALESHEAFELFTSVRYDPALVSIPDSPLAVGRPDATWWNAARASPFYMLDFHRDRLLRAATYWRWDAAVAAVAGEAGLVRLKEALEQAVSVFRASTSVDTIPPLRCRALLCRDGSLSCSAFATAETPLISLVPPCLPPPGFMCGGGEGGGEAGPTESRALLSPLLSPLLSQLRAAIAHRPYEVALDMDGTASSAYTHYKTTRRQMYDAARQRAGITGPDHRKEVILVRESKSSVGGLAVMDGSISTVYFWRQGRWVTPPVPVQYGQADRLETDSGGLDGTTRRWALEQGLAVEQEVVAESLSDGEECWLSNGVRGFLYGRIQL